MTLTGKRHKEKRHDCYISKSDKRILNKYRFSIPVTPVVQTFALKLFLVRINRHDP